jgi:hypothetical protein
MASRTKTIPLMKFVATGVGLALCGVDTWLNAEHIAHVEGWASSLVAAVVVASIGASAALPLAERAAKTRQAAKAVGLALFFVVMVAFSFCASVERIGGKRDGETARPAPTTSGSSFCAKATTRPRKPRRPNVRKARPRNAGRPRRPSPRLAKVSVPNRRSVSWIAWRCASAPPCPS